MALTIEQHIQVYHALDAEVKKAAKAAAKAEKAYNDAPVSYGNSSVERETAAIVLSLRNANRDAAYAAASSYFNTYIKNVV